METMDIEGYHFYLKKFGGYSEDIDLREFVKDQPVNTIVVDFCAFYMSKLKSTRYVTTLLLEKIMEKAQSPARSAFRSFTSPFKRSWRP